MVAGMKRIYEEQKKLQAFTMNHFIYHFIVGVQRRRSVFNSHIAREISRYCPGNSMGKRFANDFDTQLNLQHDWDAYRKTKNSINTKLKEAHNNYYKRLFDNSFSGNRRQFWKYIRTKRQDKPDIPALFVDHQPIHSAKDKANALNSHFKSVFTEENLSTIPTMDNHTDVPNMPDISISQAGIYQLLTSLDEHKASGPDRISPCKNNRSPIS